MNALPAQRSRVVRAVALIIAGIVAAHSLQTQTFAQSSAAEKQAMLDHIDQQIANNKNGFNRADWDAELRRLRAEVARQPTSSGSSRPTGGTRRDNDRTAADIAAVAEAFQQMAEMQRQADENARRIREQANRQMEQDRRNIRDQSKKSVAKIADKAAQGLSNLDAIDRAEARAAQPAKSPNVYQGGAWQALDDLANDEYSNDKWSTIDKIGNQALFGNEEPDDFIDDLFEQPPAMQHGQPQTFQPGTASADLPNSLPDLLPTNRPEPDSPAELTISYQINGKPHTHQFKDLGDMHEAALKAISDRKFFEKSRQRDLEALERQQEKDLAEMKVHAKWINDAAEYLANPETWQHRKNQAVWGGHQIGQGLVDSAVSAFTKYLDYVNPKPKLGASIDKAYQRFVKLAYLYGDGSVDSLQKAAGAAATKEVPALKQFKKAEATWAALVEAEKDGKITAGELLDIYTADRAPGAAPTIASGVADLKAAVDNTAGNKLLESQNRATEKVSELARRIEARKRLQDRISTENQKNQREIYEAIKKQNPGLIEEMEKAENDSHWNRRMQSESELLLEARSNSLIIP